MASQKHLALTARRHTANVVVLANKLAISVGRIAEETDDDMAMQARLRSDVYVRTALIENRKAGEALARLDAALEEERTAESEERFGVPA